MNKKLVTVPASYEILTYLDNQSVPKGIEYCGRICYKSEDKITDQSAPRFCSHMVKSGHNSVLEMRVLTYFVRAKAELIDKLLILSPKYLFITELTGTLNSGVYSILVTGSIRAFREMVMMHPNCVITSSIAKMIEADYPFFFSDITPIFLQQTDGIISVKKIRLHQLRNAIFCWELTAKEFMKHRHMAVKFIVNRAVTHEIVRHRPCSFLQESQRYCRYSEDRFGNRVTFIRPMFYKKTSTEYAEWEKAMLFTEKVYFELLETSSPQAARTVLPNSCKTEIIVFANLLEWSHIFHMRTSKAAEPSMREVMVPLQKEMNAMFPECDLTRRFPEGFYCDR